MAADLTHVLELHYVNYVTNAFILVLRTALAHPFTPEKFRYDLKTASKRQVAIYRGWARRQTSYPAVIVSAGGGDFSITTVGQEEGFIVTNEQGVETDVVYTGTMTLPVEISIRAKSATDREKLTDLISIYVRFVFREKFYKEKIAYVGISSGEDGEEVQDGEVIYKGKVTVSCQTEFEQKLDLTLLEAVEAINLTGILYGTAAADVQPNEGT